MLSAMPSSKTPLLCAATVALLALSACSSEPPHALLDSKVYVQLVRNSAAERIPVDAIAAVVNSGDTSTPCGGGDPECQWVSTVIVSLSEAAVDRSDEIYTALVESYIAEGWTPEKTVDAFASLEDTKRSLTLTVAALTVAEKPSLRIVVTGECVRTDGENSAEVKLLEGR